MEVNIGSVTLLLRNIMPQIRAHHKTRSGCRTCKQRKVKCDEELPMCQNCTGRGIKCVWINAPLHDAESGTPADPSIISRRTNIAGTFDLLTLELIHHYATSTSRTLSSDPAALSVWRIVVPQIALRPKNQCLLHAILAMSALHVHHANPTADQYAVAASTYYQRAKMGLLRIEKDDMADLDTLFVTMSLIALYGFATTSIYSSEWHTTTRSMTPKVSESWPQLRDGILSPMLTTMAPTVSSIPLEGPFSSSLSALLSATDSQPGVEELQDVSVYDTYKEAIRILGMSWRASFQKDSCIYASCMWWSLVPNMFFRLLAEGKPRALIILAHYCVMMKRVAEDGPWWAKKQWGDEAAKILSGLDTQWTSWLGWLWSQLEQPGRPAFESGGMDFMVWLS